MIQAGNALWPYFNAYMGQLTHVARALAEDWPLAPVLHTLQENLSDYGNLYLLGQAVEELKTRLPTLSGDHGTEAERAQAFDAVRLAREWLAPTAQQFSAIFDTDRFDRLTQLVRTGMPVFYPDSSQAPKVERLRRHSTGSALKLSPGRIAQLKAEKQHKKESELRELLFLLSARDFIDSFDEQAGVFRIELTDKGMIGNIVVVMANEKVEKVSGYTEEYLTKLDFMEKVDPFFKGGRIPVDEIFEDTVSMPNLPLVTKNGLYIQVDLLARRIPGTNLGVFYLIDQTERKSIADDLADANKRIAELTAELKRYEQSILQQAEEISRLTTSHSELEKRRAEERRQAAIVQREFERFSVQEQVIGAIAGEVSGTQEDVARLLRSAHMFAAGAADDVQSDIRESLNEAARLVEGQGRQLQQLREIVQFGLFSLDAPVAAIESFLDESLMQARAPLVSVEMQLDASPSLIKVNPFALERAVALLLESAAVALAKTEEPHLKIATQNVSLDEALVRRLKRMPNIVNKRHVEPGDYIQLSFRDNGPSADPTRVMPAFKTHLSVDSDESFASQKSSGRDVEDLWLLRALIYQMQGFIRVGGFTEGDMVFELFFPAAKEEQESEAEGI